MISVTPPLSRLRSGTARVEQWRSSYRKCSYYIIRYRRSLIEDSKHSMLCNIEDQIYRSIICLYNIYICFIHIYNQYIKNQSITALCHQHFPTAFGCLDFADDLFSADEDIDSKFNANIVVYHDGNCSWIPLGLYISACSIDIQWFPFDDQYCHMKFGSWTYDGSQVNLTAKSEFIDLSAYQPSGEWDLIGTCRAYTFTRIHFTTYMYRPIDIFT